MVRKSTRKHKLEAAVARIHARFGPGSLTRGQPLAIPSTPVAIPHIPTGFADLDDALRIGGLPKGKICEIVGQPTSGKTTLALKFLVQAQAGGAQVAYIDQARFFDTDASGPMYYLLPYGYSLSRLDLTAISAPEFIAIERAGAARAVCIVGMGGVGKSVLAATVVWEVDVQRAFPDGNFWVEIGEEPDLLTC